MRAETSVRRRALSSLGRSLAFRLLVAGMLLYTLYHCVSAFSPRLVTDLVVMGEERQTVSGEAVLFRDEQVITVAGGPMLCSYAWENGAKVSAESTLAQLYATTLEGETLTQMQATLTALDRQIAIAQRLPTTDTLSRLAALQRQAREQIVENTRLTLDGAPMSEVSGGAFSLLLSLDRISALTGQTDYDASELLSLLRGERQRLLMVSGYSGRTVTVADAQGETRSGYFYYADRVDGYEETFAYAALADMTLDDLDAYLAMPRRTRGQGVTVVGKLAASHRWGIAVSVDPLIARDLEVGDTFSVRFTDEYEIKVPMELIRVIGSVADGRAVLILSATELPEDFTFTRFSRVEITLSQTEGYRVPETALTSVEGVRGVYVLDGGRVSFRAVQIVLEGDGYVLVYAPTKEERESEQDATYRADRYLALQDVVIVEGEDLYDGKYID